jgi:hypothetical protein
MSTGSRPTQPAQTFLRPMRRGNFMARTTSIRQTSGGSRLEGDPRGHRQRWLRLGLGDDNRFSGTIGAWMKDGIIDGISWPSVRAFVRAAVAQAGVANMSPMSICIPAARSISQLVLAVWAMTSRSAAFRFDVPRPTTHTLFSPAVDPKYRSQPGGAFPGSPKWVHLAGSIRRRN